MKLAKTQLNLYFLLSILLINLSTLINLSATGGLTQKSTSMILRISDSALLPQNDSASLSATLNLKMAQFNVKYFRKIYATEHLGTFYGDLFFMTCSDTTNGFDTLVIDSLKNIDGIYGVVLLNHYVQSTCSSPVTINDDYKDKNGNTLDWGTHDSKWQFTAIDAFCGWGISSGTATDTMIAIIEGFVDLSHPDLVGKITTSLRLPASQLPNGLAYTTFQDDHGTHVMGTAVAATNDGIGIASTGFNQRAAHYEFIKSSTGGVNALSAVLCILNAARDGHRVINGSFTNIFYASSAIQFNDASDFLSSLVNMGISIVLSSGNGTSATNGKYEYTESVPGVIVVGGIGEDYNVDLDPGSGTKFYNKGTHVDIYAPAYFIMTTTKRANPTDPAEYAWTYGTSIAAPIVSATIGHMLALNPNLSPADIECYIKQNYDPVNDKSTYSTDVLTGRLSLYKVLDAVNNEKNTLYPSTTNITMNTSWNNVSYTINDNITISSGSKLDIINSTIKFSEGKGIIVNQGGKLEIDNSTLTASSNCATQSDPNIIYSLWNGIQIFSHGNTASQNINTSGYVEIKNNSLIENAHGAIRIGTPGVNNGGGIVIMDNSTIKNCRFHVSIYEYIDPNNNDFNLCKFNKVDFLTDKKLNYYLTKTKNGGLNTSIWMYHISGILFSGCKWQNSLTLHGGRGIGAWDCKFKITDEYLTTPTTPCPDRPMGRRTLFENLSIGIHSVAGNASLNRFWAISCEFKNCQDGISMGTDKLSEIIDCDFNYNSDLVYPTSTLSTPHVHHVLSNNSQAFTIADCNFQFQNGSYTPATSPIYFGVKTLSAREGNIVVSGVTTTFVSDVDKSNFEAIQSPNTVIGQGFYDLNYNFYMNCNKYNEYLSAAWVGNDNSSLNSQLGMAKRAGTPININGVAQGFYTNNKFESPFGSNQGMVGVNSQLFNNYSNPFFGTPFQYPYIYYSNSSSAPDFPDLTKNTATKAPLVEPILSSPCTSPCPTDYINLCSFDDSDPFYDLNDVFCRFSNPIPLRNSAALSAYPLLPPPNNDSNQAKPIENSKIKLFLETCGFSIEDVINQNPKLSQYLINNITNMTYENALYSKDILMHWFEYSNVVVAHPSVKIQKTNNIIHSVAAPTEILLFPNPNNGQINIKESSNLSKVIFKNLQGEILHTEFIQNDNSFSIHGVQSGLIFCELFDAVGNFIKVEKIILFN